MPRKSEDAELEGEWRRDPTGRNAFRLWDGTVWTDRVSNHGVRTLDPMTESDHADAPSSDRRETATHAPPASHPPRYAATPRALPKPSTGNVSHRVSTSTWLKTTGGALALLGGVLAAIGPFLPFTPSVSDLAYVEVFEGLCVAIMGFSVGLLALFGVLNRQSSRVPAFTVLVLSGSIMAVTLPDYREANAIVSLGWDSGLTLCLVGAALGLAGALAALIGQTR